MSKVTKFLLLVSIAIISLCAVSCTESDDAPTVLEGDLVLTAPAIIDSKSPVGLTIDFTAKMGGVDVTTNETLVITCVDSSNTGTALTGTQYTPSTSGYFKFYATCTNDLGESVTSNVLIIYASSDTDITLTSSLAYVVKGSTDELVTFTAKMDGTTMSINDEGFALYMIYNSKSTQLSSLSQTISTEGDYSFYATYTDESGSVVYSNSVSVGCTTFDNIAYNQRTLAVQCTGTWCGYCPFMTSAIYHFEEKYGTDKVVFVAAHYDETMYNSYSYAVLYAMNPDGYYPRLFVGSLSTAYAYEISAMTYAGAASGIATAIGKIEDNSTNTAIAMSSTGSFDSFSVSAAIAVREAGSYGVGAMIVEDGIIASQETYYELSALDLEGYDLSNHKNVLQAVSNTSTNLYQNLASSTSHTAGSIYEFSWSIDASNLTTLSNPTNCRAIVYTVNKATGYIDNVVQAPINTSRSFDTL